MIPRAWCPSCGVQVQLLAVVDGKCPECGTVLEEVVVDLPTWREITIRP